MDRSTALLLGFVMGITFVITFVLIMWAIRPLVIPRHGSWVGNIYFVGALKCGDVDGFNGWNAYSDPPFWVGLGYAQTYQTRAEAVRAVESACK